jgi:16S rRNA (guanine966-N2)-methyltransferase
LHPPKGLPVRPTTDFAKTALFNILNNRIDFEETKVLDLFAGTGSISFEFISRGCAKVVAVDKDFGCIRFIKETIEKLDLAGMQANKADVFGFIKTYSGNFDLIFCDPPYDLDKLPSIPDAVFETNLLAPDGLLIVEHSTRVDFSAHTRFTEQRSYGKVNFSFFA